MWIGINDSAFEVVEQCSQVLKVGFSSVEFAKLAEENDFSGQGWQYHHLYYRKRLAEHGTRQSMSRKDNCYDNCIMKSFFSRMKKEMYYGFE